MNACNILYLFIQKEQTLSTSINYCKQEQQQLTYLYFAHRTTEDDEEGN